MTDPAVLVALISLLGTLFGSVSGVLISNKLTTYRIEQLEKKLDRYASNVDEMRERLAVLERDVGTAHQRIDELKSAIREKC